LDSRVQEQDHHAGTTHHEKENKQAAVPEHPARFLDTLQLSSIRNLETFGWQLFFVRRSNPDETLTLMDLSSSGETAVIEKDGTVNRTHGAVIRVGDHNRVPVLTEQGQ
jgi:hypothetical protein